MASGQCLQSVQSVTGQRRPAVCVLKDCTRVNLQSIHIGSIPVIQAGEVDNNMRP